MKYHILGRTSKLHKGQGVDWATAEALAFGSLLLDGKIFMLMCLRVQYTVIWPGCRKRDFFSAACNVGRSRNRRHGDSFKSA
jgi:hypothetical protein